MTKEEFYTNINSWLTLQGFTECYHSHNREEYHYIKDGIRVICKYDSYNKSGTYHLHLDYLKGEVPISIRTGLLTITKKPQMIKQFNYIKQVIHRIENFQE